jgi:hypothetical protein
LTATHGHISQVLVEVNGAKANHVELGQERLPLAEDELLLLRIGVAHRHELAFDLHGAVVGRPRQRYGGLTVTSEILEHRGCGRLGQVGNETAALVLPRTAVTRQPFGRSASFRVPMWMARPVPEIRSAVCRAFVAETGRL